MGNYKIDPKCEGSAWPFPAQRSSGDFRNMDPERQREIASMGGKAAHAKGTAHEFTSEEAVAAGRKGGLKRAEQLRAKKILPFKR